MDDAELSRRWHATKTARAAEREARGEPAPQSATPTTARALIAGLVSMLDQPAAVRKFEHAVPDRLESPLEERMAALLVKVLEPTCTWEAQHEVCTRYGLFRLDFLVIGPGGAPRIAIECDGAKHHQGSRDDWRDAALLGSDAVDAVIRIRGRDIHRRPWDVVHALCTRLPSLFTARGRAIADRFASAEIREGLADISHCVLACYHRAPREDGAVYQGRHDTLLIKTSGTISGFSDDWRHRYDLLQRYPELGVSGCAEGEDAEIAAILAAPR